MVQSHSNEVDSLRAGQQLGAFVLTMRMAEGMGEVWLAEAEDGSTVVLKTPAERYRENPEILARFENEVLHLRSLQHRNIVRIRDSFFRRGRPFLVLEYLPGGSLADRIDHQGPLAVEQAILRVAVPILAALGAVHENGVVHRDIKPDNIIFGAGDVPYLADFGIACVRVRNRLTRMGAVMGTPEYMSPEQSRDAAGVSYAADIYSFGITLYEMLTGQLPANHLERTPARPSSLNPLIPEGVDAAIMKALETDPARRHVSAGAMSDALCEGLRKPSLLANRAMIAAALMLGMLAGWVAWFGLQSPASRATAVFNQVVAEQPQPAVAPAPPELPAPLVVPTPPVEEVPQKVKPTVVNFPEPVVEPPVIVPVPVPQPVVLPAEPPKISGQAPVILPPQIVQPIPEPPALPPTPVRLMPRQGVLTMTRPLRKNATETIGTSGEPGDPPVGSTSECRSRRWNRSRGTARTKQRLGADEGSQQEGSA